MDKELTVKLSYPETIWENELFVDTSSWYPEAPFTAPQFAVNDVEVLCDQYNDVGLSSEVAIVEEEMPIKRTNMTNIDFIKMIFLINKLSKSQIILKLTLDLWNVKCFIMIALISVID
jgi:hypothetical protein